MAVIGRFFFDVRRFFMSAAGIRNAADRLSISTSER
jgi:hypothetical protein